MYDCMVSRWNFSFVNLMKSIYYFLGPKSFTGEDVVEL